MSAISVCKTEVVLTLQERFCSPSPSVACGQRQRQAVGPETRLGRFRPGKDHEFRARRMQQPMSPAIPARPGRRAGAAVPDLGFGVVPDAGRLHYRNRGMVQLLQFRATTRSREIFVGFGLPTGR